MRDLNPEDANWVHDGIEWIGEALEHIGASAQLETKVCTIDIKDHRGMLPADLYYINQVGLSNAVDSGQIINEINELTDKAVTLTEEYQRRSGNIDSKITKSIDGTYSSVITEGDVEAYSNFKKTGDYELRDINARLVVLENTLTGGEAMPNVSPIKYCTSNMPRGIHCDDCANNNINSTECYLVENDYVKTSFESGMLCLGYKAFPTDVDCFPMVPDSISFKEAMFWYIYKKMLLGGLQSQNGIQYDFADNQWKFYCTQARNEAVFPDIDRYESFMNQWVRLIPNINRHSMSFDNLGEREDIYRGRFNTYGA